MECFFRTGKKCEQKKNECRKKKNEAKKSTGWKNILQQSSWNILQLNIWFEMFHDYQQTTSMHNSFDFAWIRQHRQVHDIITSLFIWIDYSCALFRWNFDENDDDDHHPFGCTWSREMFRANDVCWFSHFPSSYYVQTHHYFSLKFSECHQIYSNDSTR